jgi:hypothetical protein
VARFEGNVTEPPHPALPGMLSRIHGLRTLLLMEKLAPGWRWAVAFLLGGDAVRGLLEHDDW